MSEYWCVKISLDLVLTANKGGQSNEISMKRIDGGQGRTMQQRRTLHRQPIKAQHGSTECATAQTVAPLLQRQPPAPTALQSTQQLMCHRDVRGGCLMSCMYFVETHLAKPVQGTHLASSDPMGQY